MKGIYAIKFSKTNLADEFLNYFNKKLYKKINIIRNKSLTLGDTNSKNYKKIPKICIDHDNNYLPLISSNNSTVKSSK